MNYFRKLRIKRLWKQEFSLNELLLIYPEYTWKEIVKVVREEGKV